MQQNKAHRPTSRCGLNCNKCPAFIANVTNDDKLREKTADEWNK